MANLRQVADAAGVSPATASRVLGISRSALPVSNETQRRVREAAKAIGYRVNYHMRSVATGRAYAIGFAQETTLDAKVGSGHGNSYFDALRRGVEYTTQETGSALVSVHPGMGSTALRRGTQYLLERRIDALIVPASNAVVESMAQFEADPQLPLVMLNYTGKIARPKVTFDLQEGLRLIVAHLVSLGHRRALWLGPRSDSSSDIWHRCQMFTEIAHEAGLHSSACLGDVSALGPSYDPDSLMAIGQEALRPWLVAPKRNWTAIVAFNDQWAAAACAALWAAGLRVPADVSVVGFDNLIAAFCVPPLTTIDHQFYEMGCRAGALAARLVDATGEERAALLNHVDTVAPVFTKGASTGPALG